MNTLDDLTEQEQRLIAADFAEHVLPLFEADYPDDDRPRKAIEAARAFVRGQITIEQLEAARDAAWAAASAAASAAARDAALAATRDAALAAARDAAWAAAGDAARAAARAAAGDAERAWQQQRIDAVVAARAQA